MKRLTIISHTEHYRYPDGTIVGLGSTVTEINLLLDIFDTITHVAMLHDGSPPKIALPYQSDRITFVAIPTVGGKSLFDKLSILRKSPQTLNIVKKALKQSDYFQFRAPTGIGIYIIPYLMMFSSKKGWFKYAGNWVQEQAPLVYRVQRWLLQHQNRIVTINGSWPNQPKQCLTFENPCLTDVELVDGQRIINHKKVKSQGIQLCFVGRLEEAKGLGILIEAIQKLTEREKSQIEVLHIVGNGSSKEIYLKQASEIGVSIVFHGFLSRSEVHDIYKKSHAILLPSASEGFPKVIAEAMNYGCLPIVSNVSSLSHYVSNNYNGILLETINVEGVQNALQKFLALSDSDYHTMITSSEKLMFKFTYGYYNHRITTEIL